MSPISPVKVGDNGRYFVDRDGSPVFWLGDTLWELFRCFTPETAMPVLRDRQAKGFNVILIMLTGVDHARLNRDGPFVNVKGEAPWLDDDPLKPNERYFGHVDAIIRLGEETGQTFVVGVYHQWHKELIPIEKARAWARWVAERYRHVPNLIWSMYPRAEEAYVPVCQALAAGLREGDGGAHLISVHPDPAVASSSFLHDEPWLAFNMIQTCTRYERIYETVLEDYNRVPTKPVVMAEGGYEGVEFGRRQTAYEIRKQAYWTQLAGGHHVYGHNDAWTAPERWRDWIDAPGSHDLRHFKEIITGIDGWWRLVPDPTLITEGQGQSDRLNVAVRSADGDRMLTYLSAPARVKLRLTEAIADRGFRVQMIDPATGERPPAEVYTAQATLTVSTPAGWEDALILIETRR